MHTYPRLVLSAAIGLCLVGATAPRGPDPTPASPQKATGPTLPVVRTPMMVEIDGLVAAERAVCERLHTAFLAATDEAEALALQRETEAAKRGTEIRILEVQLDYAQREGRPRTVEALRKSLQKLRDRIESSTQTED